MGLDQFLFYHNNKGEEITVHYWRKFNAVQAFFEKFNGGDREFTTLDCRGRDLDILLESCEKAYKARDVMDKEDEVDNYDHPQYHLPTTSGLFFGSTDYNDYYFDQVWETGGKLKMIKGILGDLWEDAKFTYLASW